MINLKIIAFDVSNAVTVGGEIDLEKTDPNQLPTLLREMGLSVAAVKIRKAAPEQLQAWVEYLRGKAAKKGEDILSALGPLIEITVGRKKLRVMENEVTVGLFARFVGEELLKENGYRITRHNAKKLQALIADESKANDALYYVSFNDGVKFIEWLKKETDRQWDFMTNKEFDVAKATGRLKGRLSNWLNDFYMNTRARVLRFVGGEYCDFKFPENRYLKSCLRLVDRTRDERGSSEGGL